MDAELEKLVESGKLTARQADQLEKLPPGTFCLHKSWGFGRVAEWNLLLNQILIDFPGKKAHSMQLPYAAENLTVIPPEHFLAKKANDLKGIKELVKKDPTALMRNILESLGGSATVTQISQLMLGDIFSEPEWKRWWDSTKKLLNKEGYFLIPTKKSEPIQLRGEKVSRADELITFFNQARQPKEQAAALDQIIKFHNEFEKPETQLQPIIATIEEAAARNQRLNPALVFELVMARDDLLERCPKLKTTNPDLTLNKLIADEEARLITILPKLPAAKERRVLQALPAALGPAWTVAGPAIDAEPSRPGGLAGAARFCGSGDAGRAARVSAARDPRALGHERDTCLALPGARRRMAHLDHARSAGGDSLRA